MQLELKNLTKRYGSFTALDCMNITFTEGIYGILGANGAGKSTMMNLLTDNIPRTDGQILFDGTDILKLGKDFRRLLGYMPQQQGYYEHMTAQTFLSYMADLKAIPKKQAKEEIERLLTITNLSNVRHKKLGGYSGGMKQRVLLAQALLGDPKVVILDEPTAGLDQRAHPHPQLHLLPVPWANHSAGDPYCERHRIHIRPNPDDEKGTYGWHEHPRQPGGECSR